MSAEGGGLAGDVRALPTGVVSFLLTDIVGSTALWDRMPTAMATNLERHDDLVDAIVESWDGVVLKHKGEGDSTLSVFARATDAVAAGLDVLDAIAAEPWAGGLEIRVRAAVHTGEAFERRGDYFGPTVNRAARVRGVAEQGELLVTSAVIELVTDQLPAGAQLVARGEHTLRGLERAERLFAVTRGEAPDEARVIAPTVAAAPQPLTLAVPASLVRAERLVGRDADLHGLLDEWTAAQRGEQRMAVLGGEAGIGKTTLAAELANTVHSDGGAVLFGRCEEGLAVPYQPFIEALRPFVRTITAPDDLLSPSVLATATRLWPELRDRAGGALAPVVTEDPLEQHALFEAVVACLASITSQRPALLVLDDLHWATRPTILMLRHLVATDEPMRLLVACTYRDTDIDAGHPLAEALAAWRRSPVVSRTMLTGLTAEGVAAWVGQEPGDFSSLLARETGGNPFFIGEVLADLGDRDTVDVIALPSSVRDVLERRIAVLPRSARAVLSTAAILGQSFSHIDLLEASDVDERADVIDVLDSATATGLLREDDDGYAFAHALVRQTLLAGLSRARRSVLHRRVGEAIANRPDAHRRAAELALHFTEAGDQPARAAQYLLAQARGAIETLALDDARDALERARTLAEEAGVADGELGIDLNLALAMTLRGIGVGSGREAARDALAGALEIADGSRAAEAALFLIESEGISRVSDETRLALDRAAGLPDLTDEAAAKLGAATSSRLMREGRASEAIDAAQEATVLADRSGSERAQYHALIALFQALLGTPRIDEVEATIAVSAQLAARTGSVAMADHAAFAGALAALVRGNRTEFERVVFHSGAYDTRRPLGAAGHIGDWVSPSWNSAMLALLDGRWDDAAILSDRLLVDAGDPPHPDFLAAYAGQVLQRAREMGTAADLLPLLEDEIAANPTLVTYRAGLAAITADIGQPERALTVLDDLAGPGLSGVPRDQEFPATLALLADAAAILGDRAAARHVLEELVPYRGLAIVIQSAVLILGAADRYIGMLAAVTGDDELASSSFESALEIETDLLLSPPCAARTRLWQARFLAGRGDDAGARAAVADGVARIADLEMPLLMSQLREV